MIVIIVRDGSFPERYCETSVAEVNSEVFVLCYIIADLA